MEKKVAIKSFTSSRLVLEDRQKLTVSGVEKVISADEKRITVIASGSGLIIGGVNLHVSKLDVEQGNMEVSGTVTEIKYSGKQEKGGLFKKIFKQKQRIIYCAILC